MLRKLWRFWFGGHDHAWKIINTVKHQDYNWNPPTLTYTLQCDVCGDVKRKRI